MILTEVGSDEEETRLFKVLPDWLNHFVVIARETGLRQCNIVDLTWNQVNLFSKNITIEEGLKNFHSHDLRHDFCSKLVQKGVDLYTVAALAGHRSIRMTQRYAHLSPENLRSAVNVLNSNYSLTTGKKKRAAKKS